MTENIIQKIIAFGTDGIRGCADEFPFTNQALYALGRAIAAWAQTVYNKPNPQFLIGMDTRESGPRIKASLCHGMLDQGAFVLDGGVITTPAVYHLIFYNTGFDAGIVISASHNPYKDNGIKIFDATHCKLSPDDERLISLNFERFLTHEDNDHHKPSLWLDAGHTYQQKVLSLFPANFLKKVNVVLDCANGAASEHAPAIFKALGANVFSIAHEPNGTNINQHCGSLHPEALIDAVKRHGANCGFAFDGDSDRVIAVTHHGHLKDGDEMLALLSQHPAYLTVPKIVGTIMTNQGFEEYLKQQNRQLIRANVGDKYVAAKLKEENLPLGGEQTGHILIRDYLATGDGIFAALKILETIIENKNWEMKTFEKFPQVLVNVPVIQKKDLSLNPFSQIIKNHEEKITAGRILVRYSGTENLLRVMTEATTHHEAETLAHRLAFELQEALRQASL